MTFSDGSKRLIIGMLAFFVIAGMTSLWAGADNRKKEPEKQSNANPDNFRRPQPTRPFTPSMPSQNRYRDDKVFLEKADSLFRHDLREDIKIVKGNVLFRQGNMYMYCDSAYFYSERDAADCFGHVRMEQGDTLFIYADKLFYDGLQRMARLRCGPSERTVRLVNKGVSLTTDSLDYSLDRRLGWYEFGGELRDDVNTLTSTYGQYSPETKDAEFFFDVVLVNNRDGYRMLTDTLYYNTASHLARIDSRTIIEGENDTIRTTAGTYNTSTGVADLTSRSLIQHRDSSANVITIEGDSIVYDKEQRVSRAYMFRDPNKNGRPVILTDTARKSTLYGGFGLYDEANRRAMATEYPLLMEYSRQDTLFLRADTIRTFVLKHIPAADTLSADTISSDTISSGSVKPDSIREYYLAKAYNRARFFRPDLQGVADSITFVELDSMLYLNRRPVVWSDERQISGRIIEVHFNDSTADWARLPDKGLMMEHVDEDFFNQMSATKMFATLEDQHLRQLDAEGNVMTIFLPEENDSSVNKFVTTESSFMTLVMNGNDIDRLKMWPEVSGTVTPVGMVKKADKFLPGAQWLDAIRPRREWYGSRLRWADDLGEIPEELEIYFSTPDDGNPVAPVKTLQPNNQPTTE